MEILRALFIKATVLVIFSAAAHAQEIIVGIDLNGNSTSLNGQNIKSPENKVVRYSAGESIPLWSPQEVQKNKPVEIEEIKVVRYFAGDSIPLGAPKKIQGSSAPQKTKSAGYSGASSIPLAGALGDSVSTHIGLSQSGLAEGNGLINTSPAGLVGLFVVKAGMVYYLDHQEPTLRKSGLKTVAGFWNGVTMNNILLIAGSSSPVSIVGGALFGAYMYHREGLVLEKEKTTKNAPVFQARVK